MKKIILGIVAITVIAYACSKSNRNKITNPKDEGPKITANSNTTYSRTFPTAAELNSYYAIHNSFMTGMIEGNNPSLTNEELIASLKPYVNFVPTAEFPESSFDAALMDHITAYEGLEGNASIQKLKDRNAVTAAEAGVLNKIVTTMDASDYTDLTEFLGDLDSYVDLDEYQDLPDSSKQLIDYFAGMYRNSAQLYHPYAMSAEKAAGAACNKCIKDNIKYILLADGVGAIQGLIGCLIMPVSCAVLIPALFAVGSGAALLYRCRGKC